MTIQYQEYHGIQLAQGAELRNAVVERLVSDPSPVEVGRSWFNTTEKAYKYSTTDATGALIIRTFTSKEALDAAVSALNSSIASEAARAIAAESALQASLTSETSRATTAEGALQTSLNSEISRATGAETVLQSNIAAEAARAISAEGVLTSNLSAEAIRATAAEAALGVRVDNVISNINPTALDSISELLTAFQAADSDIYSALNTMATNAASALASEVTARGVAEAGLQSNINSEAATRASAISAAQTALSNEATARAAQDTVLEGLIDSESAARESADDDLDARVTTVESQVNGKIGDLTTLNTVAKNTVVASINEVLAGVNSEVAARSAAISNEIAARTAADTAIRTDFNSRRKTFTSVSAALEHSFAHNFNSNEIGITLWVKRDDGKFYNDQAAVQQFDANTLKVYFTSARDIKLVVENYSAI